MKMQGANASKWHPTERKDVSWSHYVEEKKMLQKTNRLTEDLMFSWFHVDQTPGVKFPECKQEATRNVGAWVFTPSLNLQFTVLLIHKE